MSNIGNKTIFSNNLRYYMSKNNLNRNDVCNYLGFKYTTFSDWYNGIKYPRIDSIEILADYFGINKSDLIEEHKPFQKAKSVKIPVLGYVRAGVPIDAVEEILDYEEITEEMARSGSYFCLKIKGDSMEPKFSEGDVVVIRQQETVENGDIAVILINGDDATIKKFYKSDAGVQLVATNPTYPPLFFTPQEVNNLPVSIIGKAVELRAKL